MFFKAQRKIPFHAMNYSSDTSHVSPIKEPGTLAAALQYGVLDLRTTPVLRRSQSDSSPNRRFYLNQRQIHYEDQILQRTQEEISPKTPPRQREASQREESVEDK